MKVPRENKQFLKAYDQYAGAIFRFCYLKTSRRETALDLTQETFLRAWEYISQGKKVRNARAFLYKVAGNLIIDEHRRKKSFSLEEMMEQGFELGFDEREKLENDIDGKKMIAVLDKLSPKYKEVILMRHVEGLSIKEIAAIIDETENNVSVRLHRGIEKINEILSEYE